MSEEKKIDPNAVLTSESREDILAEDLKHASSFLAKFTSKLANKIQPVVKKSGRISALVANTRNTVFNETIYKKLLKIIIPSLLLLVAALVVVRIINLYQVSAPSDHATTITPNIIVHKTYEPSIYAEDLEILMIQKAMKVLVNEIERTPLKDTTLTPPTLNFNVSFAQ